MVTSLCYVAKVKNALLTRPHINHDEHYLVKPPPSRLLAANKCYEATCLAKTTSYKLKAVGMPDRRIRRVSSDGQSQHYTTRDRQFV